MAAVHSSITFRLKSARQGDSVSFIGKNIKVRQAAGLIAAKIGCADNELDLHLDGRVLGLEDELQSYSDVEVVRKVVQHRGKPVSALQKEVKAKEDAKSMWAGGTGASLGLLGETEEERIAEMSAAIGREHASARSEFGGPRRGGFGGRSGPAVGGTGADGQRRAPPKNYICHACGKGGHYIEDCPESTRGERKRFSAPVGIAEAKLERVDADAAGPKFVTRNGDWVRRRVDGDALLVGVAHVVAPSGGAVEVEVQCPWCKGICIDAVRLPCCDATICSPCLNDAVENNDAECHSCNSGIVVDEVEPDTEMRRLVATWRRPTPSSKRPRPE